MHARTRAQIHRCTGMHIYKMAGTNADHTHVCPYTWAYDALTYSQTHDTHTRTSTHTHTHTHTHMHACKSTRPLMHPYRDEHAYALTHTYTYLHSFSN